MREKAVVQCFLPTEVTTSGESNDTERDDTRSCSIVDVLSCTLAAPSTSWHIEDLKMRSPVMRRDEK